MGVNGEKLRMSKEVMVVEGETGGSGDGWGVVSDSWR